MLERASENRLSSAALAALVGAVLSLALTATAQGTEPAANWSYDVRGGTPRFWTESSGGARFTLWCQDWGTGPHPVLAIRIAERPAPANRLVRLVIDRSMIKLRADARGYIRTDCPLCADQATWLWNKLRSGQFMQIQLDDGRYSGFRIKGMAQLAGEAVCSRR
jgi:hypothetical protein